MPIARRLSPALITLALCAGAARADAKKTPAHLREYTIEQFMKTTRVGGAAFSPDEKQVYFSSNKTGIFNVFVAPATGVSPAVTCTTTVPVGVCASSQRGSVRAPTTAPRNRKVMLRLTLFTAVRP